MKLATMRVNLSAGLVALCLMLAAGAVVAAPPDDFVARVEKARKAAGVPGMAIAIVEHSEVTLARGYASWGRPNGSMPTPFSRPVFSYDHQNLLFTPVAKPH